MKYWIYVEGLQRGPFTIEELADMRLTPDTPVWYEGLDNWIKASESPGLAPLLATRHDSGNDRPLDVEYSEVGRYDNFKTENIDTGHDNRSEGSGHMSSQTGYGWREQASAKPGGECPPTYLAWSIIVTICCCLPLGLVAIFYSGKVKPCWQRGDVRGAAKASEMAQIMIILSITLSLVAAPLAFLF
ncbi:MAG: CD225/dispanin family protein [Muribaculaceae bacterium]|nr:CD225/dispanin family protein [Muribaculaceae bacterium]